MIMKKQGSIKLYDRTNGKTIFEWSNRNFGNDFNIWSYALIDPDLLPLDEAIFEFQGKEYDDQTLYISFFQLTYNDPISHNEPPAATGGDDDDDDD